MTEQGGPESSIHVGRRVYCDGYLATVKYIGQVPPSEGVWYGVEWDDAGRGKHDGSHDGKQYFVCSKADGGSFLRLKKLSLGISYSAAVRDKYAATGSTRDGTGTEDAARPEGRIDSVMYVLDGNQKKIAVEMYGTQRVRSELSQLDKLQKASLRSCLVYGEDDRSPLLTPKLEDLDLSRNLLSNWASVSSIVSRLQLLRVLNLSENILDWSALSAAAGCALLHLETFVMTRSNLTWPNFLSLGTFMPNLKEAYLGHSHITESDLESSPTFEKCHPHVKLLSLDGNKISRWDGIVSCLGSASRLETLVLSENALETIPLLSGASEFRHLRHLSLSSNFIKEWRFVDNLNSFPSLRELRLKENPLSSGLAAADFRLYLIARASKVAWLNGSDVQAREREEAERFYLYRLADEWHSAKADADKERQFHTAHPRFSHLCNVHGEPVLSNPAITSSVLKHSLMEIELVFGGKSISRKLPMNLSVAKLKPLVLKLFGLPPSSTVRMLYADSVSGISMQLDDDFKELSYYSIETGGVIQIEES